MEKVEEKVQKMVGALGFTPERMEPVFSSIDPIQKALSIINIYGLNADTLFVALLAQHKKTMGLIGDNEAMVNIFFATIRNSMEAIGYEVNDERVEAILSFVDNNMEFMKEEFTAKCKGLQKKGCHLTDCDNMNAAQATDTLVNHIASTVTQKIKEQKKPSE